MTTGQSYTSLERIQRDDQTVLTVGFFDGVHLGHRFVIQTVKDHAERLGARAIMVTFDRSPRSVLQGNSVPLLTTLEEKAEIARSLGIDETVIIPFDLQFAELEPVEFVESILVKRIGLTEIVLGYDHRFGRGGKGSVETMKALGEIHGFGVAVVDRQSTGETAYSSTRIREMLSGGDVSLAARHLGRHYRLEGKVVHGDGRGKRIGFPTANLHLVNQTKVIPAVGVYAVFARLELEENWRSGIMNIGFRPTVTDATELVSEVHILDYEGDLYGKHLEVAFVQRIRDEKRFDGVDSLVEQIGKDLIRCKDVLQSLNSPD